VVATAPGGSTAFYHAMFAALLPEASPGRPHLVVVLSDGADNVSLLNANDVREIARRSDAVLHVVLRERRIPVGARTSMGWVPFDGRYEREPLDEAARITGGRLERVRVDESLADQFARTIADFRSSNVLWFTPSGVPASGWHELTVRVKRGKYTVAARRGYFGG
jgi:hypothetical protein